ncbi:hypothetical protein KL906_005334 [Ogataea polymorpha]|nr:hypothetical protein KL906_005334 [Ogataea polymorpha]KAG7912959.1 hypothetical protein KL927_005380 [Ogataea polymorpha]
MGDPRAKQRTLLQEPVEVGFQDSSVLTISINNSLDLISSERCLSLIFALSKALSLVIGRFVRETIVNSAFGIISGQARYKYQQILTFEEQNMICEDYLTGAHSMDVPQETLDKEVQAILDKIKSKPDFNPNQLFDPEKHLAWKDEYFENTKTFTLQDLGITKTHTKPINNFGATYPFPLLTEEAIDIMKWEAFQPQIVKKYARLTNPDFSLKTNRHDFHIAGYPEEGHAPFTKSVYEHPRLKEIFSQLIGMDVTTTYGYDVNHVNVALADFDMPLDAPLYPEPEKDEDGKPIFKAEEVGSILGQHYDSTSIACVIMWECPQDKGGETVIITGDETPLVIPNIARPGYCTLLQARVIRHIATKPNTNSNRIATVAGYYPTAPILDNSCLTSVRPSILPRSVHDQFYTEWFDFRFKQLERVLADKRKKLWDAYKKGESFDQKDVIEFSKECQQYLFDSWREMEFANNDPYPPPLFSKPYSELTYEVGADNSK